jgi:hypothetical protein
VVQAAERLYEHLWGEELKVIVEHISDNEGTTWKYVPEKHLASLQMRMLGYGEGGGLLVRPEYDVAIHEFHHDTVLHRRCGGVVVTGQPGIGTLSLLADYRMIAS